MTRKLASIQRIVSLTPIDGADKIETARVLGWDVVVGKGDFLVGDLAVFFEIDSFLSAEDPRYAGFEPRFITWNDKRGMRLKTIRLRGQLSQGLLMPVSKYPEIVAGNIREDTDVTEYLGIEKWEAAEPNGPGVPNTGKTRVFPSFIRKTDQERVQNYGSKVLENLDTEFQVTIKKDGSSMTAYIVLSDSDPAVYKEAKALRDGKVKLGLFARFKALFNETFGFGEPSAKNVIGLCSRNVQLDIEGSGNFHTAFRAANLKNILENCGYSIAIQGELVAPSIQGNYEKVNDVEFHVFSIFSIMGQKYWSPKRVEQFCYAYGLKHATVLKRATLRDLLNLETYDKDSVVKAILDLAEGPGDNPGVKREGLVFKAFDNSLSFKAISNSYLLKTGK